MPRDERFERKSPSKRNFVQPSWHEIDRYMEQARDLRAEFCCEPLSRVFRWVRRALKPSRNSPAPSSKHAATQALLLSALVAAAVLIPSGRGLAQEIREMAVRVDSESDKVDRAALAELGLVPEAIERCDDAELLWRAVRELVLTQLLSEPMQQRILRRAWIVDPAVRMSSVVESATN